MAFLVDSFFAV